MAIGDLDLATAQADRRASSAAAPSRCALDVTERESFAAFLDGAEEQLGPLDVLVNNAGIMQLGPVRRARTTRPPSARSTSTSTA